MGENEEPFTENGEQAGRFGERSRNRLGRYEALSTLDERTAAIVRIALPLGAVKRGSDMIGHSAGFDLPTKTRAYSIADIATVFRLAALPAGTVCRADGTIPTDEECAAHCGDRNLVEA